MKKRKILKRKILMVDDEEGFTKLMKMSLEDTGEYEVRIENEGNKALTAVREFNPDLVLLDVVMPDMDGGEVFNQIKADKNLKDIPIVFLTALVEGGEVTTQNGLIGGHPFLPKPITEEQLLTCIKENLKK